MREEFPSISNWLSDEEYAKAVGQFRLQLNGVMQVFMLYGQQPFVLQAIDEIVMLAEAFGMRVRGVDYPISLEHLREVREQKGKRQNG